MQIVLVKTRTQGRRALSGIVSAPLMTALATISIGITLAVAIGTVLAGRVPAAGPLGLICAVVLAAVAAAEGSRPARCERSRRRTTHLPPAGRH